MTLPFEAVQLTDKVWWVGAIDWAIRDFHGYETSRGTTYNAFLVTGERPVLIDTVKRQFKDELMARIASVMDPEDIDVIVSNHAELDHSGCLPDLVDELQPSAVYASRMGAKALGAHFGGDLAVTTVKDGQTVDLGDTTLRFFETRMLHWPDSMVTYLAEGEVLFSQDAFGMHLATSERFADQVPEWLLEYEAAKYYANILMLYSKLVPAVPAKLTKQEVTISMLAPDHGPVWREDPLRVVEWYGRWAAQAPTRKAVVVYDTMWGSTYKMARAVEEGLVKAGCAVKVIPLGGTHRSDVATELLEAGALVVGSPTLNNALFPTVADVLTYLKGLKPQHLVGAAFGSHGWSGDGTKQVAALLQDMGVTLVDSVATTYVPDDDALRSCHALGVAVGEALVAAVG